MAGIMKREERLASVRAILRAAGPDGARIRETTPKKGGLRGRDVELLVAAGEAEWLEEGVLARLREGG